MEKQRVIIKNGTIVDGSGQKGYKADVFIEGDTIKAIGILPDTLQGLKIDAGGKVVTPGFFDSHRHCDYALLDEDFGRLELAQGITSTVTGSCGLTPFPLPANPDYRRQLDDLLAPCLGCSQDDRIYESFQSFADYLKKRETKGTLPMNIGGLMGSCTLRINVKGFASSPFTQRELELIKSHIDEGMENGAIGLSMGIMYYPEYFSSPAELVQIAGFAAAHDGILTCHIRGEGDSLVASLEEVIEVAGRAQMPLQISHLKSCGVANWGKDIYRAFDLIDRKRAEGIDVMVDFYPYHGGSTTLLSLIPPAFLQDTLAATWRYMETPAGRSALGKYLEKKYDLWDNYILSLGYDKIMISSCQLPHNRGYVGKSIQEIVTENNLDPVAFISQIMAEEEGKVGIIVMSMSPADVDEVARLPYSYLISDGLYSDASNPHPRLYGAFPKMIRDFALTRKVLTFEEAIHKMTYMPARRMRASKRGLVREGFFADINVFSPENIRDNASFLNGRQLATGMDYVFVNGKLVWEAENKIDNGAGCFLSGKVVV